MMMMMMMMMTFWQFCWNCIMISWLLNIIRACDDVCWDFFCAPRSVMSVSLVVPVIKDSMELLIWCNQNCLRCLQIFFLGNSSQHHQTIVIIFSQLVGKMLSPTKIQQETVLPVPLKERLQPLFTINKINKFLAGHLVAFFWGKTFD